MNTTDPMSQHLPPADRSQNDGPFQLNVILHGLWGIETNKDGIRAVTVHTMHHVTKAGDLNKPVDLPKGEYRLQGVNRATPMTFEVRQNLVFKERVAKRDKVKVAIELPYPRDIRRIQTHGDLFFIGPDAPPTPREIAIVQALIYEVKDPAAITLDPLKWSAPRPNGAGAINLHIFSEPPNAETTSKIALHDVQHPGEPPHFKVAFGLLADAFGLRITAVRTGQAEPDDYGIRGLTPQDTIGLHERPSSPKMAMPATSPVNCEMLISDNTYKEWDY
jgi:hypothetical protein